MPVTVTSSGIEAVCVALGLFAAASVFIVDSLVAKHIRRLNGTYLRSEGVHLTGAEIERRLEGLEDWRGSR